MPNEKRTFRLLLLVLLNSFFAAGCDFLDKGESDYRVDTGVATTSGSTIDISGGQGTVGGGGSGEQDECGIWFDNYGPLGVKVYRTGTADASFTLDVPAPTLDFGVEPLTVTTDTTIPVYDSDPAENNVHYFLRGEPYLYHKIDDSTINTVTGIRVNAGATLTLPINADLNSSWSYESAYLYLENDLEVAGTLRTAAFDDPEIQESGESKDRAGLTIHTSGGIFVRSSGVVNTAGDNAATGRGGYGGAVEFVSYAEGSANGGLVVNQGLIDASGGNTDDPDAEGGNSAAFGGYGNRLNLYADVRFVNTGTIRADGGSGSRGGYFGGWEGNSAYVGGPGTLQNAGPISLSGGTGSNEDGGNGARFDMEAGEGFLHNSGAITARGGNGATYGGSGGTVNMYVNNVGDLLNSGAIDAGGGDSTGTDELVAGSGGQGGQIYLYTYGGRLMSSGQIAADGGDVATVNAESYGGQGGYVDIESYPDYYSWTTPAGAMEISGNIFARGGAGPTGGYGGMLYIYYEDSNGTGGIVLRGYSNLVNNGGPGVTYGGDGGGLYLDDYYSGGEPGSGALLIEADISANGGAATAVDGYGGYGGYVELYTNVPPSQNAGITVDGGAGTNPGGPGSIYIDGGSGPE